MLPSWNRQYQSQINQDQWPVFITLIALSLYGCEHLTKSGGMEMLLLIEFFLYLDFTLVIL